MRRRPLWFFDGAPISNDGNISQYNRVRGPLVSARANTNVMFAVERGYDAEAQIMGMELEGIDQTGETSPNDSTTRRSIKAFLGSATVSATLIPESKTKVTLLATVLSGDGSAKDDKSETFNTVFGTNHKFYGIADYVPDLSGDRGLVDFMAGASTSPSKEWKLALEGHALLPQRGGDAARDVDPRRAGPGRESRTLAVRSALGYGRGPRRHRGCGHRRAPRPHPLAVGRRRRRALRTAAPRRGAVARA